MINPTMGRGIVVRDAPAHFQTLRYFERVWVVASGGVLNLFNRLYQPTEVHRLPHDTR